LTAPLPAETEDLLAWLGAEKGRSANTLAAYRRDLAAYQAFLADRGLGPAAVTEPVVEEYLEYLRAAGRAPASVARALVSVRALHRFLEHEGRAAGNPAGEVTRPEIPAGSPNALTEAQVAALLGAVGGDDAVARRDRAILEVLYGCGLRVSELVGLALADVHLGSGSLRVPGKGPRKRAVPVGRPACDALAAWLSPEGRGSLAPGRWAGGDDADAVFLNTRGGRLSRQGAWGIVRRHGAAVGLGGRLSPHVLRHSCATHMLDHGADVRVVQELLGHASISTVQADTRASATRLRQAYEAAHPRA
jgi:integrase/recombinase XerD